MSMSMSMSPGVRMPQSTPQASPPLPPRAPGHGRTSIQRPQRSCPRSRSPPSSGTYQRTVSCRRRPQTRRRCPRMSPGAPWPRGRRMRGRSSLRGQRRETRRRKGETVHLLLHRPSNPPCSSGPSLFFPSALKLRLAFSPIGRRGDGTASLYIPNGTSVQRLHIF